MTLFDLPAAYLLSGLLVIVIYTDLRHMRIPHLLLGAIGVLFLASFPWGDPASDPVWRGIAALIVLAVGFALFAQRLLGGGDVKLLPLITLFAAPSSTDWALLALMLSAGVIAGLVLVRALRHLPEATLAPWTGLARKDRYPLGPGLGLGGIGFCLLGPQVAQLF